MHKTKTKREVAAAWCEATTVHGVADTYRAKQNYSCCEFVFWLCVVLVAFCLATWQILGVVQSYAEGSGYTTNINFERKTTIPYPNIVTCNINRATKTAVKELNISSPALELFFGHFYSNSIFELWDGNVNATTWQYYETQWQNFLRQNSSTMAYAARPDLLMDKLAHKCKNMLLYMKNGLSTAAPAVGGANCCANTIPVKNIYGRCLSIGMDKVSAAFAGPEYGLRMMGVVESREYMSDVFYNYNFAQGFLVFLTSNHYEPMPVRPILIRKGTHTMIEVSQKTYKYKDPSQFEVFSMPCVKNAQFKTLRGLYTADACVYDCTIWQIWTNCNCTPVNVEIQNTTLSQSLRFCDYNKLCRYLAMTSNETTRCMLNCKVPCEDRVAFTASVTSYDIPSNNSKDKFAEFISKFNVTTTAIDPGDVVLVDIFYSQMDQMVIETVESTALFSVISNIGGQLGLWMGASMVSIVQAVHYFITMLRAKLRPAKVSVGT